jgi:hypothetical protein
LAAMAAFFNFVLLGINDPVGHGYASNTKFRIGSGKAPNLKGTVYLKRCHSSHLSFFVSRTNISSPTSLLHPTK